MLINGRDVSLRNFENCVYGKVNVVMGNALHDVQHEASDCNERSFIAV